MFTFLKKQTFGTIFKVIFCQFYRKNGPNHRNFKTIHTKQKTTEISVVLLLFPAQLPSIFIFSAASSCCVYFQSLIFP